MKHTVGPWLTARNNVHLAQIAIIHGCRNGDWVEVWSPNAISANNEMNEANARLIAAAPELLALVKRYRAETPLGHQPHMIAHEADAVIAKATMNDIIDCEEGEGL